MDLYSLANAECIETCSTTSFANTTRDPLIESASRTSPSHIRPRLRRTPDINRGTWHTSPSQAGGGGACTYTADTGGTVKQRTAIVPATTFSRQRQRHLLRR